MTNGTTDHSRWRQLAFLAAIELLAMSLWFSASAVSPLLQREWGISAESAAWLTIAVQVGFVCGALASAALNLADRFSAPWVLAVSALLGAVCNGAIVMFFGGGLGEDKATAFSCVVFLRFLTGAALAGVYPTGMKLMATWFAKGRGLAIGALVGALTVGSASPHLVRALLPLDEASPGAWRWVLAACSLAAVLAAGLSAGWGRVGPHHVPAPRLEWSYCLRMWFDRPMRQANFGYLGHMFELYAMWTWVPQLLAESYRGAGWSASAASGATFFAIASGLVSCLVAGLAADRVGRCVTTAVCLGVSGGCALAAGWLVPYPTLLTIVCVIWGLSVVADSAQFSAAISELCDPRYVGAALAMQTCAGFLLTTVTIRALPGVQQSLGWPAAAGLLALGPAFGVWHMLRLRASADSQRLAGGAR